MRLLSLTLLLSAAVAMPSAQKSCSGVGFPCGNATMNALDCCIPLVCGAGAGAQPVCKQPGHGRVPL